VWCVVGYSWCIGPPKFVSRIGSVIQWAQFCTSTPTQVACAASLQRASQPYEGFPSYYHWLVDVYIKCDAGFIAFRVLRLATRRVFVVLVSYGLRKRTLLLDALNSAGLKPVVPDGGYFILAQTEHLPVPSAYLAHSTPACPTMTRYAPLVHVL
jgi:aspartate/methionine/tyrosine aminotransferase